MKGTLIYKYDVSCDDPINTVIFQYTGYIRRISAVHVTIKDMQSICSHIIFFSETCRPGYLAPFRDLRAHCPTTTTSVMSSSPSSSPANGDQPKVPCAEVRTHVINTVVEVWIEKKFCLRRTTIRSAILSPDYIVTMKSVKTFIVQKIFRAFIQFLALYIKSYDW